MLEEERLPTALWVEAHLRHLNSLGQGHYIIHKGAYASGMVLVKIRLLNNFCRLLVQMRDLDGNLGWMNAQSDEQVAESIADAYIRRAVERDPDLWVIEVEDRNGQNPFEGQLIF